MSNIEKYLSLTPENANRGFSRILFENNSNNYDVVELVISIKTKGINIKELSSYLDFLYKIDGHLSGLGYKTYVQSPNVQIEIDEIRIGSWEIVIERVMGTIEADKLAIIYLALKYLPNFLRSASDSIFRYYEILDKREDFLEKKIKREQRRQLRDLIKHEFNFDETNKIDKRQLEKVIKILEELYTKVGNKTKPASRFGTKFVRFIKLIPKNKRNKPS